MSPSDNHRLDEHGSYTALGISAQQRCNRYIAFLAQDLRENERLLFRTALQRGQLTGDDRFVDQVEHMIGRRIAHRAPGNQARKHTR